MAVLVLKPFRFYVLTYIDGKFEYALITEEYLSRLELAKLKAVYNLGFSETDVPVILDHNYIFHYYDFSRERWFNNCSDEQLKKLFPHLVPLPVRGLDISSNVGVAER